MSNDKHTPTPWRFDKTLEYIFDANDDYPILEANSFEAAERAVQCVNEYDGLIETIATLRAEKAELIEALERIKSIAPIGSTWHYHAERTLAKYETKNG
jgi:hypothetical protein